MHKELSFYFDNLDEIRRKIVGEGWRSFPTPFLAFFPTHPPLTPRAEGERYVFIVNLNESTIGIYGLPLAFYDVDK